MSVFLEPVHQWMSGKLQTDSVLPFAELGLLPGGLDLLDEQTRMFEMNSAEERERQLPTTCERIRAKQTGNKPDKA